MKNILIIASFILFKFFMIEHSDAQNRFELDKSKITSKYIEDVASTDLLSFLERIPSGNEKLFGFDDRANFSKAIIGEPFEIFTLSSNFFLDDSLNKFSNYIVSTGIWRAPIMVNNQVKALATISIENKKWRIVKIGAIGLANELYKFFKMNKSLTNFKFIRVYQIKSDFILTNQNIIYPLESAKRHNCINNDIYNFHELLNIIKKEIK